MEGHLHRDSGLIASFVQGDENAFTSIYDRFYQRVYFFARRFVEPADAKDITAEAFIGLWKNKSTFSGLDAISRFLFVSVRNRCIDLLRHRSVRAQKQEDLLHLLHTASDEDMATEQVRAELIKLIYQEVEKLPPAMKNIFLLSYREGLKPAEIAQRLQISVQTVSNQKLSAIRLLRAALGNDPLKVLAYLLLIADR